MAINYYDVTVPIFDQALSCQLSMLHKSIAHVESKNLDPSDILGRSFKTDGRPLMRHAIQGPVMAAGACVRLAKVEFKVCMIDEKLGTFHEVLEHTAQARSFILSVPKEKFIRDPEETFMLSRAGARAVEITVKEFVLNICLPKVLFHSSMVYSILCDAGVGVGPIDFPYPPG